MHFEQSGYKVTRHVCPRNCYGACGMLAYTHLGVLKKVTGDPSHGYTNGKICAKGYSYVKNVYHPDRLKYPMIQEERNSGNWKRISWDEALDIIVNKIIELNKRYNSNLSLALNKYSGNFGIMHYAVEGLFNSLGATTQAIGSPCWSTGLDANYYDFGSHQTSDPSELKRAKLIVLWGVNPAWTAVHSMPFIYEAKENGAKVVVIDPVYTSTAKKADLYIQVRPSSDGALAIAIAKIILNKNLQDNDFIKNYTYGFEHFKEYLKEFDLEVAVELSGQSLEVIENLANMFGTTKPIFIWTGFGLQRHVNGGQNLRAINALGAITGNIGVMGGGVHFAQQTTWNFNFNILNKNQTFNEKVQIRKVNINNFSKELKDLTDPPVKFLWVSCRNLLTQDTRKDILLDVLKNIELIVNVDHFLTKTAEYSDIVLPATTHFEEMDVVPGYWHHWIGINQQAIEPYYESKSDLMIAQLISKKLNKLIPGFCDFPELGKAADFIEKEFNKEMYDLLEINHWSELIEGPKRANIPFTAWQDKIFHTPSKKYEFYADLAKNKYLPPIPSYSSGVGPSKKYPYWLLTPHAQQRLNSQFQKIEWALNDSPEPTIYINPKLAEEKGLKSGDMVVIFNEFGQLTIKVKHSNDIAANTILYYQNSNSNNELTINNLIPGFLTDMGQVSTGSEGVAFYDAFVDIEKYNFNHKLSIF